MFDDFTTEIEKDRAQEPDDIGFDIPWEILRVELRERLEEALAKRWRVDGNV